MIPGKHVGQWRSGDYLVIDERTGEELWRSECTIDWDGTLTKHPDGKHPDYEKKQIPLEAIPQRTAPPQNEDASVLVSGNDVGLTTVPKKWLSPVPVDFLF